jgi:arabinogalactan endo-1,4-beta-galactosidase
MRRFLAILIVAAACFGSIARAESPFIVGTDFSDLAFFESRGITYKDGEKAMDGLQILKNHGFNCVRLRIWTSSTNQAAANPYNYGNNLPYTLPLAVRVKKAGLLFSLDFHYSDTWADPGKQFTPAAWTNLDFGELVAEMHRYNSNTIATFATAGAMPDFVQVGNEITGGMLWPLGRISSKDGGSCTNLAQLMKAAVQGIREGAKGTGERMPKIIVHIDRGADWNTTKWFFDNLDVQKVPYDIIGESYYPFFHGPLTNLNVCLSNAAIRFHKPVMVAEVAFPWTNLVTRWTNKLYGFNPTVGGQVEFMSAVRKVVDNVPEHLGAGIFYWGAEYQPMRGGNGGGFSTASLFDFQGNVLPAADALGKPVHN